MAHKRKIRNGYLKKTDFCNKYNIKISVFNKRLVKLGFLEYVRISSGFETHFGKIVRYKEKWSYAITNEASNRDLIMPYIGSNRQGSYQYHEKYFSKVFGG